MKRAAPIRIVAALCVGLCFAACDKASELPFEGDGPETPVSTIADLKRLCQGTTHRITNDITIRGIVTANDTYGEFIKTIVVQDESGGIPILLDHTSTQKDYPFGTRVTLHSNGLALGRSGGRIQLGAIPTGEYSVDRIAKAEIGRYLRTDGPAQKPIPDLLRFEEVTAYHIDRFVCFENVRFTTEGPWCDPDPETLRPEVCEREIADARANTFTVRVPGSCTYATEPVPSGTGSIYGIIEYFNGKYSLNVTNYMLYFKDSEARSTAYLSTAEYSFPTPTR